MRCVGFVYRKHGADPKDLKSFADIVSHRGQPSMSSVDATKHMLDSASLAADYHISADLDVYNGTNLANIVGVAPNTDTKLLILLGYRKEGLSFFDRIQGKWAVCIYDKRRQQVICSRDRLGMNTIYMHQTDQGLSVSSELKQMKTLSDIPLQWNTNKLGIHLEYASYNTNEESVWKEIIQVQPGHHMTVDLHTNEMSPIRYYDLRTTSVPNISAAELLKESVANQSADIDSCGVLLSGGLDSSIVAYHLAAQGTSIQSVSYIDKEYSEEQYVDAFVAQYPHPNLKVKIADDHWLPMVAEVTTAQEAPLTSLSIVAHYQLLKEVAKTHRVMLNGQGADTVFAGNTKNWTYLPKTFLLQSPIALVQLLCTHIPTITQRILLKQFPKITTTPDPEFSKPASVRDYMLQLIEERGLRDLLYREDRNSRVHGVQARYPFADHTLIEAAYWLPDQTKLKGLRLKAYLYDQYKNVLPREILQRQKSLSFDTPEFRLYKKGLISLEQEYAEAKEQLPSLIRDIDLSSIPAGEHKIYLAWRFYFLNRWLELNSER